MTALAQVDRSPAGLVRQYQGDFAVVLPSHIRPDTFARVAIGALRRDPKLNQAAVNNPAAFLSALLDAARRGLEPGTEQYYLVPQKVKGQLQVRGQVGYQGVVELIYRAGAVSSVIVECVRQHDGFAYRPGRDERPQHDIDWDAQDRGDLRLVYAYAVMKDGATSKVVVLNRHDIDRAKQSSESAKSEYSPWRNHEEAMWMKTAVHRLAKWVPTSAEYLTERLRAAAAAAQGTDKPTTPASDPAAGLTVTAPDGTVVDVATGEITSDPVYDAEIVDDRSPEEPW